MRLGILGYNRIIIVGNNGSGKSFLSKELSAINSLPLIHLDVEFWKPNWEKTPEDDWIKKQINFIAKEKWIIDGNHCSTMELRFKTADMVIFLDFNRFVCQFSILKRHGKKRSDMPQYLEEKLDLEFLRFCKRMWNFSNTGKITIMELHKKYPDKPFILIKSRSELKKMLVQWKNEKI
jgi:adenylate kinase family enzyme